MSSIFFRRSINMIEMMKSGKSSLKIGKNWWKVVKVSGRW